MASGLSSSLPMNSEKSHAEMRGRERNSCAASVVVGFRIQLKLCVLNSVIVSGKKICSE